MRFRDVLLSAWVHWDVGTSEYQLKKCFERCAASFKDWGLSTFGRIPKKIKELHTEMAKINYCQMSVGLEQLCREKEKEVDHFLALDTIGRNGQEINSWWAVTA